MGALPLRGRVAAALLVVAAAMALVLSAAPAPAAGSTTTLTLISGGASVTRAGGTVAALGGELLQEGDEVRTTDDGYAVLTFADGSTITLEPAASVRVEAARLARGEATIRLFQAAGRTWSSVSRLIAPGSRFEVTTGAATASVRGTAFEVEVAPDGTTIVRTSEGTVAVSNELGSVDVPEATESRAAPGAAPAAPAPAPPATRRVLEVGEREVVIVDAAGRACGRQGGRVVQQIPGCVVRVGAIEIQNAERVGDYRLAVTADVGDETVVVERTRPADSLIESVRTVELPAEVSRDAARVASPEPALDVTLPLIGVVPVQVDLRSAAPAARTAPPEATGFAVPSGRILPIPFGSTASPAVSTAPSQTPTPARTATATPTPLVTIPPLLTTPSPTPTASPPPDPTPTAEAASPTPAPLLQISPLPSVDLSPSPTPTASPSPTPTASPSPTVTPTPTATPRIIEPTCVPDLNGGCL